MSIVRIGLGETKHFAEGYEAIFGKTVKPAKKDKKPKKAAKKSAAKARKKTKKK